MRLVKTCDDPCLDPDCKTHCMHDELDRGVCVWCGVDRTEDLLVAAYDLARGIED